MGKANELLDTEPNWAIDPDASEDLDYQIGEYDIISSPNDFNVLTIYNFIESGAVLIPGFQRHYVWDQKRASKLIESLLLGLPIPQIFLYEEERNKFLVIDGQQRLMSIYYFIKGRFPRPDQRSAIRKLIAEHGALPEAVLSDDHFFTRFDLRLPTSPTGRANQFQGKNYETLLSHQTSFNLRTIRNVIVKQIKPQQDNSSMYELFNRLNTGGVNLKPQEIRASIYHSEFYDMLARINELAEWRRILNVTPPDIHMKDIEILLRCFAVLTAHDSYKAPMVGFLDTFSKDAKRFESERVNHYEQLFRASLHVLAKLPDDTFLGESRRFNISLFEAVFVAISGDVFRGKSDSPVEVSASAVASLASDPQFESAAATGTTNRSNLLLRLERARAILSDSVSGKT